MHVSERRACAALGQHRSTQRKVPRGREDEERLTADTIALARQYGRYGYRKIAGLLEPLGRVPAAEIEALVVTALRNHLNPNGAEEQLPDNDFELLERSAPPGLRLPQAK